MLCSTILIADDADTNFQGKKLCQWFAEFSEAPASVTDATRAIQSIGSNAVPYLTQFLSPTETDSWRKRAAISALAEISTNAVGAVPAMIRSLDDMDLKVQADAASALSKIGKNTQASIPALRKYLAKNNDSYNGLAAAVSLWRLDEKQAPIVVPALTNMLIANGRFDFNAHVLSLLAEIGPAGRESVPTLKSGLQQASEDDRGFIREVLERIQGHETCGVCGATLASPREGDLAADSINAPKKAFHHYGIHDHVEAYLVCIYQVLKKSGAKLEIIDISATIVDCLKGKKNVGEKLTFNRCFDSKLGNIDYMDGTLYYVFFTRFENGEIGVDAQDPVAMWNYSDELRAIVDQHRSICMSPGH